MSEVDKLGENEGKKQQASPIPEVVKLGENEGKKPHASTIFFDTEDLPPDFFEKEILKMKKYYTNIFAACPDCDESLEPFMNALFFVSEKDDTEVVESDIESDDENKNKRKTDDIFESDSEEDDTEVVEPDVECDDENKDESETITNNEIFESDVECDDESETITNNEISDAEKAAEGDGKRKNSEAEKARVLEQGDGKKLIERSVLESVRKRRLQKIKREV